MNLRIRLFAVAKEIAGREILLIEVPLGTTVAQLRQRMASELPALAPLLPQMLFAVGTEYARDDMVLSAEHDLACIPPVSGG